MGAAPPRRHNSFIISDLRIFCKSLIISGLYGLPLYYGITYLQAKNSQALLSTNEFTGKLVGRAGIEPALEN